MPGRTIRDKIPDAFVLSLVVILTGCAALGPPQPVEVSLDRTEVSVRLSDGTRCTGPVDAVATRSGTAVSGMGQLRDCTVPLAYRVEADLGANPVRVVLEEVFTAIGLENAVAPSARITLSAPDGRTWSFASPAG